MACSGRRRTGKRALGHGAFGVPSPRYPAGAVGFPYIPMASPPMPTQYFDPDKQWVCMNSEEFLAKQDKVEASLIQNFKEGTDIMNRIQSRLIQDLRDAGCWLAEADAQPGEDAASTTAVVQSFNVEPADAAVKMQPTVAAEALTAGAKNTNMVTPEEAVRLDKEYEALCTESAGDRWQQRILRQSPKEKYKGLPFPHCHELWVQLLGRYENHFHLPAGCATSAQLWNTNGLIYGWWGECEKLAEEKRLALAMGVHQRLGQSSLVYKLHTDNLEKIAENVGSFYSDGIPPMQDKGLPVTEQLDWFNATAQHHQSLCTTSGELQVIVKHPAVMGAAGHLTITVGKQETVNEVKAYAMGLLAYVSTNGRMDKWSSINERQVFDAMTCIASALTHTRTHAQTVSYPAQIDMQCNHLRARRDVWCTHTYILRSPWHHTVSDYNGNTVPM